MQQGYFVLKVKAESARLSPHPAEPIGGRNFDRGDVVRHPGIDGASSATRYATPPEAPQARSDTSTTRPTTVPPASAPTAKRKTSKRLFVVADVAARPLARVVAASLLLRILDLIALAVGGAVLSGRGVFDLVSLREGLVNWDGHWYLGIAANGYSHSAGTDSNVAFFPLFPLLTRWLAESFDIGYVVSATSIAALCSLVLPFVVFSAVKGSLGESVAYRATLLMLCFPTAFFLILPYPESLFALCVGLALGEARKRRWNVAAVAASVTGATKVFALSLVPSLLWEALDSAQWRLRAASNKLVPGALVAAVAPLVGLGAWSAYLWAAFGEPFAFYEAQMAGWPHARTTVVEPVVRTIAELAHPLGYLHGTRPDLYFAYLLDIVSLVFAVALVPKALKCLPPSWTIFWLSSTALALFAGTTNSIARYQLGFFPLFAAAATVLDAPRRFWPIALSMAVLQLAFAYAFGRGWWVG